MGNRALHIAKNLLAAVLFLAVAAGLSFDQAPAAQQQAAAPPASAVIPLSEVATKASEIASFLTSVSETSAPSPEIEKIRQSLPELIRQIDLDSTDTYAILGDQPPLKILQAQQALWLRRQQHLSTEMGKLTQRASALHETLDRLSALHDIWALTHSAAQAEQAEGALLQQIQAKLASIGAAQMSLKNEEGTALALQGNIARELARCEEVLAQIVKAQKAAVEGILSRDNPPIWDTGLWSHARAVLSARLREISRGFWLNIVEYLLDPSRGMPLHIALFGVLAAAAVAARRKKRRWTASGIGVSDAVKVFERPYSAALLIVLLFATSNGSSAPARVKDILSALMLVPMIRLICPAIDPRLHRAVFAAVVLSLVDDLIRQSLGGVVLGEQALLIMESVAAIAVLRWELNGERLSLVMGPASQSMGVRWAPVLAKAVLLYLTAGFLSAALGYTRLARLLTPAVLYGAVSALSLYASVRVLSGALAVALRTGPLQRLQMVRNHCDRIEGWIWRVLAWAAAVIWGIRSLDYIGLLNPILSAVGTLLDLRLERGSISISIEDILAFGLTVWASYLLSAFIRFALQEEVYPRRGIARGLSYAYSRLVHYIILALGFLVGLGVLGMDLTKVSVLAGAFGVGIGFGLQDVVNNFVCGLILLFERPVTVGDIVEVGGLQGEVRRIGIRASTVRTYQGADIIVPNSQFITANVTNWTLSDQLRRIDLPVGVNYGAAPQKVIELLETAAAAHKGILEKPPPQALFMGCGDSSINFELRAWTDQFGNSAQIRSELASAVYDAVYAAGMSFPFPQREVRVLGKSGNKKTGAPRTDGGTEPAQKR